MKCLTVSYNIKIPLPKFITSLNKGNHNCDDVCVISCCTCQTREKGHNFILHLITLLIYFKPSPCFLLYCIFLDFVMWYIFLPFTSIMPLHCKFKQMFWILVFVDKLLINYNNYYPTLIICRIDFYNSIEFVSIFFISITETL